MKLSDFSLLKEDVESYSIGHPKGKSIRVSKKGLSGKAQEMISKLKREQGLADGGEVKKKTLGQMIGYPGSEPKPEETKKKGYYDGGGVSEDPEWLKNMEGGSSQQPTDIIPQEPQLTQQTSPIATGIPASAETIQPQTAPVEQTKIPGVPDITGPLGREAESIKAGVRAEEQQGLEDAKIQKSVADNMAANAMIVQGIHDDYKMKDDSLRKSYDAGDIDPDRYMNSMGTGSKISSAIAMILGGIGSGLTGGPNLAAKQLDDAINRDIDSQKEDKSKRMNLWKMNKEVYQSDLAANLATQNQMLIGAQHKIMASAVRVKGPLAQQRAAKLTSDIEQRIAGNRNQMAVMKAASLGGQVPLEFLLEEKRERAVTFPGGGYAIAPTKDDAKVAKAAIQGLPGLEKQIQEMEEFQKETGTTFPYSDKDAQADAMQTKLAVDVKTLFDLGALTVKDFELINKIVPNPGQWMQGKATAQLGELRKLVRSKLEDTVATRLPGYNLPKSDRFTPEQQAKYDYAKRHPEDPRSAIHLKKLGVE